MKTLAELKAECATRGITPTTDGRASREPYILALRDHLWRQEHPRDHLPPHVMPMLLGSWDDLDPAEAAAIEQDQHAWCVQPKLDGVRALLHVQPDGIRITGRTISEVTYRLSEFQPNLPHLTTGLAPLAGSILDGELVSPAFEVDTGETITAHPLQAAVAILATSPENARLVQDRHQAHLRFHAFDILAYRGRNVSSLPLFERLELLRQAVEASSHPDLHLIPTFIVGKPAVHHRVIAAGGGGHRLEAAGSAVRARQACPPLAQAEDLVPGRGRRHRGETRVPRQGSRGSHRCRRVRAPPTRRHCEAHRVGIRLVRRGAAGHDPRHRRQRPRPRRRPPGSPGTNRRPGPFGQVGPAEARTARFLG